MRKIFVGKFKSFSGDIHEVHIYDRILNPGVSPKAITLNAPGYTINYNAGITDFVVGGIIETECTINIKNVDHILDTMLALMLLSEQRFLVEIYRAGSIFWRGILLSDFSEMADLPEPIVTLTAVDGVGLLDSVYMPIDPEPNKVVNIVEELARALRQSPISALFGEIPDVFLYLHTAWEHPLMRTDRDPMYAIGVGGGKFGSVWSVQNIRNGYNGQRIQEDVVLSCKEVIAHICQRFHATLVMSDGCWYFIQRSAYINDTIELARHNKYGGDIPGTVSFSTKKYIDSTDDTYRSEGKFSQLPALKRVKTTYLATFETKQGLFPNLYALGQVITTFPLTPGVGNFLHIQINFFQEWSFSAATVEKFRAIPLYALEVKIGTYYLHSDLKWRETPSYYELRGSEIGRGGQFYYSVTGEKYDTNNIPSEMTWTRVFANIFTGDVPIQGEATIKIYTKGFAVAPFIQVVSYANGTTQTQYNNPENLNTLGNASFIPADMNTILYIVNNEKPYNYVTFTAENTEIGATAELIVDDSLFGTAGQMSRGLLLIDDGTKWVSLDDPLLKFFRKKGAAEYIYYFNELLAWEILSMQRIPTATYSGTMVDRKSNNLRVINSFNLWVNNEWKPLVINNVTYNPQLETWEGDWFVCINATGITSIVTQAERDVWKEPAFEEGPRFPWQQASEVGDIVNTFITNFTKRSEVFPQTVRMGYFYNHLTLTDERKITASDDWKVPTTQDYQDLWDYIWAKIQAAEITATDVGEALKEQGEENWDAPNIATNEFHFNARGSGFRKEDGMFDFILSLNYLWTLTTNFTNDAWAWRMINSSVSFSRVSINKKAGCAVRLYRDASPDELLLPDGTYVVNGYIANNDVVHRAVKIGNFVWLADSLMETLFRTKQAITRVEPDGEWAGLETPGYCVYGNSETYGGTQENTIQDFSQHIGDTTIHYKQEDIDHDIIKNRGWYRHEQIDTHINSLLIHVPKSYIDERWVAIYRYGFFSPENIEIEFNELLYRFTIRPKPPYTSWKYMRKGIVYEVIGSRFVVLIPIGVPPKGTYYISINSNDGTLQVSPTSWTLDIADNSLPVAVILWDNAAPLKYCLAYEVHSCLIDRRFHWLHHYTVGAKYLTGGELSGCTINTDTNIAKTFAIAEAWFADEDIKHTIAALPKPSGDTNGYLLFYRQAGAWYWDYSHMPFLYNPGTNNIQYDNNGVMTDVVGNGKFVNSYLLLTNFQSRPRHIIIAGRNIYANIELAKSEAPSSFDFTGLDVNEKIIFYKLIWERKNIYASKGKVVLAVAPIPVIISIVGAVQTGSGIVHNSLSGREELDCHPLQSITGLVEELEKLGNIITLIAGETIPANSVIRLYQGKAWVCRAIVGAHQDKAIGISTNTAAISIDDEVKVAVNGAIITVSTALYNGEVYFCSGNGGYTTWALMDAGNIFYQPVAIAVGVNKLQIRIETGIKKQLT